MKTVLYVEDAQAPMMFALNEKRKAIQHAQNVGAKEVLKQTLTKDAVIRLHNGGGGYVESEEVVWQAESEKEGV